MLFVVIVFIVCLLPAVTVAATVTLAVTVTIPVTVTVAVAVVPCVVVVDLVVGGTNNAVHQTIERAALAYVFIVGVYHLLNICKQLTFTLTALC